MTHDDLRFGDDRVPLLTRDVDFPTLVAVRHAIERCAAEAGLGERDRYLFVVAVNEVTTNAIRHGGGRGRVQLWRDDRGLHCRVVDQGPGIPPGRYGLTRPAPETLGGRGLWLARQGCQALTVDSGAHGSSVTLTVPLERVSNGQSPAAAP
jgi:anti-sigma regulatory factor (Ser/Thr protein kinase)